MSDFLARESELLGDEFSGGGTQGASGGDDFDFDRAASAFPDISLDGAGDIPSAPSAPAGGNDFDFDDFDAPKHTEVKVTGDDEIEKFEDQFPDIDVPVVRRLSLSRMSRTADAHSEMLGECSATYTAYIWRDPYLCAPPAAVCICRDANPVAHC